MRSESDLRSSIRTIDENEKRLKEIEDAPKEMAKEIKDLRIKLTNALKAKLDKYQKEFDEVKSEILSNADDIINDAKKLFESSLSTIANQTEDFFKGKKLSILRELDGFNAEFGDFE